MHVDDMHLSHRVYYRNVVDSVEEHFETNLYIGEMNIKQKHLGMIDSGEKQKLVFSSPV